MLIKLFGGLQIIQNEQPLTIARQRERTLLTYLLLHPNTAHRREKLIELLWPESDSERNGRNFANVLYRVQQVVGKAWIVAEGSALRLAPTPDLVVDLWRFDQLTKGAEDDALQEAITLYAGDRLTPTANLLPDQHDDWLLPLQTHYHECFLNALQRLGQRHEQAQRWDDAQQCYQRLRRSDPLHEDAYAGLMRVYARLGRLTDVTACYRELETLLQQELAAAPSSTLRALLTTLTRTPTYIEQPTAAPGKAPPTAPSAQAIAHNFPKPLTSLVGRTQELDQIGRLLANHRLITLTGAGGSGKTRLAIAVARELADTFEQGAWWIDLSPLTEAHLVAQILLQTLGLTPSATTAPLVQVIDHLAGQQCLLVLDNCEHLLAACAPLVETLLQACDDVQILATSREPLGVAGEMLWLTPTLAIPMFEPRPDHARPHNERPPGDPVAAVGTYAAIQLFVERARAVRQDFHLTAQNVAAVLEICQRLDGIPLAIELAAARSKVLTPEQLAQRLQDRFRLLVNPQRNALPRQQTLQALIDWSYNLLSAAEQRFLCQLAVFADSFTLDAAEALCGDEALEWLARLVDKSMVLFFERQGEPRYRLLETIRAYADDRLQAQGDATTLHLRHADYWIDLATRAECNLTGPQQAFWLERLDREHDNIRGSLRWLSTHEQPLLLLTLTRWLGRYWYFRSYFREGSQWIQQAIQSNATRLDGADAPVAALDLYARVLFHAGRLTRPQGDYARTDSYFRQSLTLLQRLGDERSRATVLNSLGISALEQGNLQEARAIYTESLHILEGLAVQVDLCNPLLNLCQVTIRLGDFAAARTYGERSLALSRTLGDRRSMAYALEDLAAVLVEQGDLAGARALLLESLPIQQAVGGAISLADLHLALANLAYLEGDWGQARRAAAESLAVLEGAAVDDYKFKLNYTKLIALLACAEGKWPIARQTLHHGYALLTQSPQAPDQVAILLVLSAYCAWRQHQCATAVQLVAAVAASLAQLGAYLPRAYHHLHQQCETALRQQLPAVTFAAAWQIGQARPVDQAIALADQCCY
jgi:predicted ATPase/DNA-binding SARP family transcriptional activator